MTQISIVLGEDQADLSDRLAETLASAGDLRVLDRPTSGRETLRSVRDLEPDVLLLDLTLPDLDGLDVLRRLESATRTRTIVLTDPASPDVSPQAALLGARGAVDKTAPPSVLLKSIRAVVGGDLWFSRELTRALLEFLKTSGTDDDPISALEQRLTPRESDVVVALTLGLSNRQIAKRLKVSEHTVKQHLKQVFEKLGVSSRVELVLLALKLKSEPRSFPVRTERTHHRRRRFSR